MELKYSDIDVNLRKNRMTNDVVVLKNYEDIRQSLKLLLFTNFYTRKWNPAMGSHLSELIYMPMDNVTITLIKREIENLINVYEPRVDLHEVLVYSETQQEADNGTLKVKLVYSVPLLDGKDAVVYTIH